MDIVNFIRSYPAWAQVLFVVCLVVQLFLALLAPREAQPSTGQATKGMSSVNAPQQSASGHGNIQIAQAANVHIGALPQANQIHAEKLASFIVEGQRLRERLSEVPPPVGEHNAWVERVNDYLRTNVGAAYEVRFGDFSGMTFYGDASERSNMSRSIEGRSRRLHEFIAELSR
ncbi:MAG: hypothetical protein EPO06_10725 [Burkholderiaceae bacterium]|nr:MAG: hypothetical protein EPO06_10725 [Burkholderiaceae bacterium]